MQRVLSIIIGLLLVTVVCNAADPTATRYPAEECQGSLRPYVTPKQQYDYPDSLTPVFINHVGRHGSRFPASATNCLTLRRALAHADSIGTITALGRDLLHLTDFVIEKSNGRWGALDSLGMAEQRGIASRMLMNYPMLFSENNKINAISSYSPRSIMSMYCFTHQLARLNNRIEINASSGWRYSPLVRPFDNDESYMDFISSAAWKEPYDEYAGTTIPTTALTRVLGAGYPLDDKAAKDLAIVEYYVIAGLSAMEVECDASRYFTIDEYNALWSCFNLRQYLQRTASTVSLVPAEVESELLIELITTTDAAVEGKNTASVMLRFGHAETMMPLLSLMRLDKCYYMTNYFDTVRLHWKDFEIVPMSANLQMILFKSRSGKYYVRFDLNESPCHLSGSNDIYVPWDTARDFLMRCVPLYYQF